MSRATPPFGTLLQRLCGIAAIILLHACGGHSPTAPAAVETATLAPAAYDVIVSGTVDDSAGRRIRGVTLTVVDGARAGLTTISDERGKFQFAETIPYPSTIKATGEGYAEQALPYSLVMRTPVTGWLSFVLQSARRAPLNLAGQYVATFSADSSCNLPDLVRARGYTAAVSGRGSSYSVTLGGASFLDGANRLDALVFEDFATIRFLVYEEEGLIIGGIKELLEPAATLVITGIAEGIASEDGFDLPFSGQFWFGEYACASRNNRLTFQRR